MSVTLKDIADEVEVTPSTVSRVLNGIPRASEETQKEIKRVAKEMNYFPNDMARSLVKQEYNLIGVLLSDISNPYFSKVTSGIENIASEHNYDLLMSSTGGKRDNELKYIDIMNQKQVACLIYVSGKMPKICEKKLNQFSAPVVVISRDVRSDLPVVTIDNEKEAKRATQYLLEHGHKKIAMIAGEIADRESGYKRFKGYRNALQENGIKFREDLVEQGDFTLDSGYQAMKNILSKAKYDLPTAVFAASDAMAAGAIKANKEKGFEIPKDISVIGFDDSIIARTTEPELTTIAQPEKKLGIKAMKLALKMMNSKDELLEEVKYNNSDNRFLLKCELKNRESVFSLNQY